MTTTNTKNLLQRIWDEGLDNLDDISKDFVSDYSLDGDHYLSDLFTEYADGAISIYCSDQHNFYIENEDWCNQCLEDFYSNEDLGKLIKDKGIDGFIEHAGAVGWYEKNYHSLSSNEEDIKVLLAVKWMINNLDTLIIDEDTINNVIDTIRNDNNIDQLSDIKDIIMEAC